MKKLGFLWALLLVAHSLLAQSTYTTTLAPISEHFVLEKTVFHHDGTIAYSLLLNDQNDAFVQNLQQHFGTPARQTFANKAWQGLNIKGIEDPIMLKITEAVRATDANDVFVFDIVYENEEEKSSALKPIDNTNRQLYYRFSLRGTQHRDLLADEQNQKLIANYLEQFFKS